MQEGIKAGMKSVLWLCMEGCRKGTRKRGCQDVAGRGSGTLEEIIKADNEDLMVRLQRR